MDALNTIKIKSHLMGTKLNMVNYLLWEPNNTTPINSEKNEFNLLDPIHKWQTPCQLTTFEIPNINKVVFHIVASKWNIIHYEKKKSQVNIPNKKN
jgi:hypothetical protein